MGHWDGMYAAVGEKPNTLVVTVLEKYVKERDACLDLGAGNLRDSKYLSSQGFKRVVAVDSNENVTRFQNSGVEVHISKLEAFPVEVNAYDLIFSCSTFFFLSHFRISNVLENIRRGLKSGGICAFNVLGEEDDWVVRHGGVSAFSKQSLQQICASFNVIEIGEKKYLGHYIPENSTRVTKYWHTRTIILQKP